jgi:hypothetical protein
MFTKLVDTVFRLSLALFLLGGVLVVAVQAVALVAGAGSVVEDVVVWVGTPTFVLAGVAGLLGFVLSYLKGWDTAD